MYYIWEDGSAVYTFSTPDIARLYSHARHLGGKWVVMCGHNSGFMDITDVVQANLHG